MDIDHVWDPEVEVPVTIAVVGAGPVGIEAALYGRFLGYDVLLFDTGRPARFVKRWHNRPMPGCVAELTSSLGWAALASQHGIDNRPDPADRWTGAEFESTYLTPVAKTDLLHDNVYFNTKVIEVGRRCVLPDEVADLQTRCNDEFVLRVDSQNRGAYQVQADIVFDCRSDKHIFNGFGPGGMSCSGQSTSTDLLLSYFPLDDRFDAKKLSGNLIFLQGFNDDCRRFVNEFKAVFNENPARLLWLVRPGDKRAAEELAVGDETIDVMTGWGLESMKWSGEPTQGEQQWQLKVLAADDSSLNLTVDQVVGTYRRTFDPSIAPTLNLQKLTRSNETVQIPESSIDTSWAGWRYATCEPHYYVLPSAAEKLEQQGMKPAYEAIRAIFALLGGRADLDLYSIVAGS